MFFRGQFWAGQYWAGQFWGETGGAPPEPPAPPPSATGGWERGTYHFLDSRRVKEARRRERERLAITPRLQRKIDKTAQKLAREGLLGRPAIAIMATPAFEALLAALRPGPEAIESMAAELLAAIEARMRRMHEAEERAIIRLWMDM